MIKFDVTNRFTGEVQFTAEIECAESTGRSIKLGLAVKWAIKSRADLARAYLAGAYLAGADLARADLARADLARANLAGANLAGADLAGANLAGANLAGANLAGADLAGADLARAKWTNGAAITRAPIQVFGLDYPITIVDGHMQIGCELHTLAEWEAFENERIARMDGARARRFWDAHRATLLALARADKRSFEPAQLAGDAA